MAVISQCYCGCSLKTGTIIIADMYLITCVAQIAITAFSLDSIQYIDDDQYGENSDIKIGLITGLVCASFRFICNILLLLGAIQGNAKMLIPWMVVEPLGVITLTAIGITICASSMTQPSGVIAAACFFAVVLINVYFLRVVYSFYQSLREKPKTHDEREAAETEESVSEMAVLTQRCCRCSSKTATIIIGVFYVILSIVLIAGAVYSLRTHWYSEYYVNWMKSVVLTKVVPITVLVFGIIQTISGTLLIDGAIKEKTNMILQWVYVGTLTVLSVLVMGVTLCFILITVAKMTTIGWTALVSILIYVWLTLHFLHVVFNFYEYLRLCEKADSGRLEKDRETTEMRNSSDCSWQLQSSLAM